MCGKRLFGERGTVLPNYVNIDEYSFSGESRLLKRKEFGLADELLIGHTGSIYWIKIRHFLLSCSPDFLRYVRMRASCLSARRRTAAKRELWQKS